MGESETAVRERSPHEISPRREYGLLDRCDQRCYRLQNIVYFDGLWEIVIIVFRFLRIRRVVRFSLKYSYCVETSEKSISHPHDIHFLGSYKFLNVYFTIN